MEWKKIWGDYVNVMKTKVPPAREMSYERWLQYMHSMFPQIRLARSKEDKCDACVALNIELADPDLTPERRQELEEVKKTHIDEAVIQRRAVSAFCREFVKGHDPNQILANEILPDYLDSDLPDHEHDVELEQSGEEQAANDDECVVPGIVRVIPEDYGGSIPVPHFGFSRPSVDYYNSNLMLHNFVVPDVTTNVNHIYCYDERAAGKGADAVCSLRMRHILQKILPDEQKTEVLLNVLDSCVGQNKSQVCMKFAAMLSVVFFKKVVLVFLKSGHSHMKPDRVWAWGKGAIKKRNIYTPHEMVSMMNTVKSIKAEFLDHKSSKPLFVSGWKELLGKYFESLPNGYTNNYYFEFENGTATVRRVCSTPDDEAWTVKMCRNPDQTKHSLLLDLFGVEEVAVASYDKIRLP